MRLFVWFFRYDLAELYLKLKNHEKAEKVIRQALQYSLKSGIVFPQLSDLSALAQATQNIDILTKNSPPLFAICWYIYLN